MKDAQVTIIGFGTMGKAIAKALQKNDRALAVFGVDVHNSGSTNAIKNIKKSDFIIFAVKPQDAKEVIENNKIYFSENAVLISIMAGISIKKLAQFSGRKKIIRMMPNLGLSVGEGIAVWKGVGLSGSELIKAKGFINKITENFEVKNEDAINKITAISGSGPAYFFLLADCLINACAKLGLKKPESQKLIQKTLSAAAILGKEGNYDILIKKVKSKGGTTEAALNVFKKKKFNGIVRDAVNAAYKRATQLNK
jgi:pyrroline-5-carboxylate reductase